MQKYVLSILSICLVLAGFSYSSAKGTPKELASHIQREISKPLPIYANDRVKRMCREWPTCTQWVENLSASNKTFQLQDTEVERWVSSWEGEKAVWNHRFYAQTYENGQIKAYQFLQVKEGKGYSYPDPKPIKKFPGSPISGSPSEHTKYFLPHDYRAEYYIRACYDWPGCMDVLSNMQLNKAIQTQFIIKWDEDGNAYWGRGLYVNVMKGLFKSRTLYFYAYQTKPGGSYTYKAYEDAKYCPSLPKNFSIESWAMSIN